MTTTCFTNLELPAVEAKPSASPVIYGIDCDDMIVGVSRAWDRFAVTNASPGLVFKSMTRRRLWDHITDATTVSIYHEVLERVRDGATITLPLRCDAPTLRRWLKLTASPMPRGGVRFITRTVRQEVRPYAAILDPSSPRSTVLLTTCGWCRKFHVPGDAWVEVERAVSKMQLFEQTTLPQLTHGICPLCVESMLKLESDSLQSRIEATS